MSIRYAFVTLLTSDSYLPGALAIAGALKDIHRSRPPDHQVKYDTVCMVTPETLDVTSIKLLRRAFDVVIGIEVIAQPQTQGLALLGRPDLDTVLTKLHVFRLTQYAKVIFLDADVLPLRPLTHLFALDHDFSAAPDVGWPDIFNSGVMVLSPGEDNFKQLQGLLKTRGSWDGGDQGLLNEWRGDNWNRLSFTYNTTPTAAYTYAPAYERFGSQISAVHFIGPNKPWHSIPYRAPGSSTTQSSPMNMESPQQDSQWHAYDYGALVDRWYDVYDRHYRSQPAVLDSNFEVRRYTSAWNSQTVSTVASPGPAGGALGLEDLRRLALEGMGSLSTSVPRAHGEGEYRTMPLEGRFDLIPPRTRAERKQQSPPSIPTAQLPETEPSASPESSTLHAEPSTPVAQTALLPSGSPARWTTLPTPGPDELPPTPHARVMSLPPTPLHYVPSPYEPTATTQETGAQIGSPQLQQISPAQRPLSPPLLSWNPAIEPPPKDTPPPTVFPTDTYFPNAWDRVRGKFSDTHISSSMSTSSTSSETSLTSAEQFPLKLQMSPDEFFNPPPAPDIPEMLLRQGYYSNVTGDSAGSPSPDKAKLRRVFPWEEQPRHQPGRVFPGEEAPPPSTILVRSPHAPAIPSTPERKFTAFRSPIPSPLFGFPPSLQHNNAWDGGFAMKRRMSKLARPGTSSSPLAAAASRRFREPLEANSQDGDVESEGESEEEAMWSRPVSRGSSVATATAKQSEHVVKYRSIGVQTDRMEMRDESVQVTILPPVTEAAEKRATRPRVMSTSLRRHWPPSGGSSVLPSITAEVTAGEVSASRPPKRSNDAPALMGASLSQSLSLPTHSPRPSSLSVPPGKTGRGANVSAASSRRNSDASGASPVSSVGPMSPIDGQPLVQGRRGSRVWDPARGVDVFKRESEGVLAKFLKMGSGEDHE
ncbi:glycosyltransferase family 8 protein [Phlebopus sp. FC_14]|nr:glycosyltransferase family 8 protein [Phlebopus sp. FC_14]